MSPRVDSMPELGDGSGVAEMAGDYFDVVDHQVASRFVHRVLHEAWVRGASRQRLRQH
jgi:hypothetical protein